jgi:glyoxylase-like metal-dependent hydrolase (beta-lactamase superfamily II)
MQVRSFYDRNTGTFTHLVYERDGGRGTVIDPVLDFEPASARTSTSSADQVLRFVREHGVTVEWILETHAHADHLTAMAYLKQATGAKSAVGRRIVEVQARFKQLFDLGADFPADGRQFDRLLDEGDVLHIGTLELRVWATPGHTPDGVAYLVGDAAFIGDTLLAPEMGTARTDFPGGDARELFRSISRLLQLPDRTRLYLCHDYPPPTREPRPWTSVAEQRQSNVHVGGGVGAAGFAQQRTARDATLDVPRLILPALQVNIRAGMLPNVEANGIRYLRLPLNQIGSGA